MKFIDIEQNSDEWLNLRLGKITGSKFAVVMANAEGAKEYALQLALERITGESSGSNFKSYHMRRGHEQEPEAIALYEKTNFVDVKNGGFYDGGYFGVSPDGLVDDDGVIEVKSVIPKVHMANINRGKFDPSYKWQLMGELLATNRQWVDFISYCKNFPIGKQLFVHRVNRDEYSKDIEVLAEKIKSFNNEVESYVKKINEYNQG